jgi:type II secretory pathway component PulK
MKEIFEQYGAAIITVIVIVALAATIGLLMKEDSTVHTQFAKLITDFYTTVNPAG